MKRQRGRNRGGGGGSGGGGKPQQNANRAFESNGPDGVKVRGNAQHVFEKYQQLARDAGSAGDRVLAENYLQHAEHYFRLVRAIQPQRALSDIIGRDNFSSGYDIDFEDESGAQAGYVDSNDSGEGGDGESETRESRDRNEGRRDRDDRQRDDRPRDERQRDDRPRDERPREDRQRDDRNRDDRPRDDRPRDERPREDRNGGERQRDDRPRDDRPRGEGRRDRWRERNDRNGGERQDRGDRPERVEARDPLAVVEPQASPLVTESAPERASPVLRDAPMLRDADGGESHAPAFLQARAPAAAPEAAAEEKPARKPRRRAPRSFEGGETPPGETEEA
jgi:hypothetical protein